MNQQDPDSYLECPQTASIIPLQVLISVIVMLDIALAVGMIKYLGVHNHEGVAIKQSSAAASSSKASLPVPVLPKKVSL